MWDINGKDKNDWKRPGIKGQKLELLNTMQHNATIRNTAIPWNSYSAGQIMPLSIILEGEISGPTLGPGSNSTITRSSNSIGNKNSLQVLEGSEFRVHGMQRLQKGQCEYGQP